VIEPAARDGWPAGYDHEPARRVIAAIADRLSVPFSDPLVIDDFEPDLLPSLASLIRGPRLENGRLVFDNPNESCGRLVSALQQLLRIDELLGSKPSVAWMTRGGYARTWHTHTDVDANYNARMNGSQASGAAVVSGIYYVDAGVDRWEDGTPTVFVSGPDLPITVAEVERRVRDGSLATLAVQPRPSRLVVFASYRWHRVSAPVCTPGRQRCAIQWDACA
jgi:hypothetical protein